MSSSSPSIFQRYYHPEPFIDRYELDPNEAIDVLIPVMHTNEAWLANLLSIYREIPVQRLLLGDAGCIDNSFEVARQFPRVEVFDHRNYKSLGYSIRKLIEQVRSEWFVYLHSDVFLPPGWFKAMKQGQRQYDFFECRQRVTALVDYPMQYGTNHRPLSGSQMGRTTLVRESLVAIDDDYLYRNEDLIIPDLVKKHHGTYGRIETTWHYHQYMNKRSAWTREITKADFTTTKSRPEEVREFTMQAHGLIKYTQPSPLFILSVQSSLVELRRLGELNMGELRRWVKEVNPAWLPYVRIPFKTRLRSLLLKVYQKFLV